MRPKAHRPENETYEHEALPTDRIAPEDQEPGFAARLLAQGAAAKVPENWNGNTESLPPDVYWVLYPNGDLEPVRK
jgi:hypothetical protein